MELYQIDFKNLTPDTWTLGVYVELPGSPGLESIAWKQTTVPTYGESGVEWNIEYLVGIVNYKQKGGKGVYKATQQLVTNLSTAWQCVFESSTQQLKPYGAADPGEVQIINLSEELADLAFGIDGDIAVVKNAVYSNNYAQFIVKPKYYVALFKDLVKGEIISHNQAFGPIEVSFTGGKTQKSFVASIEDGEFIFEEQNSNNKVVASYEQVKQRIARPA